MKAWVLGVLALGAAGCSAIAGGAPAPTPLKEGPPLQRIGPGDATELAYRRLEVRVLRDGEHYVLTRDFVYDVPGGEAVIRVPRGFVTDFASVPSKLRSLVGRTGRHTPAAVVHDYLYWTQECASSRDADAIMDVIMTDYEVADREREAIRLALKGAGWLAWKGNRRDRADGYVRYLPDTPEYRNYDGEWEPMREHLRKRKVPQRPVVTDPPYCPADD